MGVYIGVYICVFAYVHSCMWIIHIYMCESMDAYVCVCMCMRVCMFTFSINV